jgi:hypothetical protein
MVFSGIVRRGIVFLVLLACLAPPLTAQIEDQLSAYTGKNAKGYLQPFADAFGADLNSGIFRSASIPRIGVNIRLEVEAMGVIFSDDDKTFNAITERGFSPEQRYPDAPTVVGSTKAAFVYGDGGTAFAFPGGFDLHSFALAVPQLRVGAFHGTEAIFRYFSAQIGDEDLGDIGLFGFGLRHSISQYFGPALPVDLAAGFFWQKFTLGEDLISSHAFSIGVQASKRFMRLFVPYTGLSYDTFSMDVSYKNKAYGIETPIEIDFERTSTMRFTVGFLLNLPGLNVFGEYGLARQSSFSFGVGLGLGV